MGGRPRHREDYLRHSLSDLERVLYDLEKTLSDIDRTLCGPQTLSDLNKGPTCAFRALTLASGGGGGVDAAPHECFVAGR